MSLKPMGLLFLIDKMQNSAQFSAVGGLENIDKRVGSWGRKKKKAKEKGTGRASVDCHPPLDKKRWE